MKGMSWPLYGVVDTLKLGSTLEDILMVKEYLEVFPDDLSRLPLEREVEFEIELVWEATPITKVSYPIAPTELKHFKIKL